MAVRNQTATKRRHYEKVLAVQTVYLDKKKDGVTGIHIYRQYIEHQFFISYRTFNSYLEKNAKRELAILDEQTKEQ